MSETKLSPEVGSPLVLTPQQQQFVRIVAMALQQSGWFIEVGYGQKEDEEKSFFLYAIPKYVFKDMAQDENVLENFSYNASFPVGVSFIQPQELQMKAMHTAVQIMNTYLKGGRELHHVNTIENQNVNNKAENGEGKESSNGNESGTTPESNVAEV